MKVITVNLAIQFDILEDNVDKDVVLDILENINQSLEANCSDHAPQLLTGGVDNSDITIIEDEDYY